MQSKSDLILDIWNYTSEMDTVNTVIPDGCQDFIIKKSDSEKISTFISPLVHSAYSIKIEKGTKLQGFRLTPGAAIDERMLLSHLNMVDGFDVSSVENLLSEFCVVHKNVRETLDCLRSDVSSISEAAKQLGISARTLQRFTQKETNRSPHFWFSLVRARRCAKLLQESMELVDIAMISGYSDQAHMTRELKKWFGFTPAQIRANKTICSEINQIGYD